MAQSFPVVRLTVGERRFVGANRGDAGTNGLELLLWDEIGSRGDFIVVTVGECSKLVFAEKTHLAITVASDNSVGLQKIGTGERQLFEIRENSIHLQGGSFALERTGDLPGSRIWAKPRDSAEPLQTFDITRHGSVSQAVVKLRVPVQGAAMDDVERCNLPEDLWSELRESIVLEAAMFSQTGKLSDGSPSPRRSHSPKSTQPKSRHVPAATNKGQTLLGLSRLFSELGVAGIAPETTFGLRALHQAAQATSSLVLPWALQTDLQRRILERQREFEDRTKQRTLYAKQLRASQETAVPTKSNVDDKVDGLRDQTALDQIDRKIRNEEALRLHNENAAKERLAASKAKMATERLERQNARKEKLKQLLEAEEDAIDTHQAAMKVRSQWDAAKKKSAETGDDSIIDNY